MCRPPRTLPDAAAGAGSGEEEEAQPAACWAVTQRWPSLSQECLRKLTEQSGSQVLVSTAVQGVCTHPGRRGGPGSLTPFTRSWGTRSYGLGRFLTEPRALQEPGKPGQTAPSRQHVLFWRNVERARCGHLVDHRITGTTATGPCPGLPFTPMSDSGGAAAWLSSLESLPYSRLHIRTRGREGDSELVDSGELTDSLHRERRPISIWALEGTL